MSPLPVQRRALCGGLLALTVLWSAAGAAPAAAAFKYVAVGDSITAATVKDGSIKFDESATWNHGGYPARLASTNALFGLGANADVFNAGVPGQTTAESLTKISDVLKKGYHVMLLMEGTNDIFAGIPTETIKSNLREIDKKGVGFGTDTVYATIIRKVNFPNHAATKALKNAIIALANERARYLVEGTYERLCPDSPCYAAHYWSTDPDKDSVGHPDASGFDIMAEEWKKVITKTPVPGATTLNDPTGDVGGSKPTYSWDAIPEANYYHLVVNGPGGGVVENTWHRSSQACSGGGCSVLSFATLKDGLHTWTVTTRNPWGLGPVSAQGSFDVYASAPAAPATSLPSGEYCGGLTDAFTWNAVNRTFDYRLVIADDQGVELHNQIYDEATICGAVICSVADPLGLGGGSYSWQVSGLNPAGEGALSAALAFDVIVTAPGQATLLEPSWRTYNTNPPFSWLEVSTADMYQLKLDGANQGFLNAVDICDQGICKFTPAAALGVGNHPWQIQAQNCIGNGSFSAQTDFVVVACSNPVDRTLDAGDVTASGGDILEEACERLAATPLGNYRIRSAPNDVIFHSGPIGVIELFDGFAVEDGAGFLAVVDE